MHCHSYALETGKYLLRLENKIYTRCIQFVLVIYILRTGYLHIMYSFFTVIYILRLRCFHFYVRF